MLPFHTTHACGCSSARVRLQLALQKAKELLHAREPMAKGAVGCRPRVAHLRSRIEEPLAGPSWNALMGSAEKTAMARFPYLRCSRISSTARRSLLDAGRVCFHAHEKDVVLNGSQYPATIAPCEAFTASG